MKYAIKNYIILFFLLFNICIYNIKADLKDYSGGGSGSAGNMSVDGNWIATYSGIKIGIVNKDNVLEDVEIILDSGLPSTMYFSYNNNPKMFQPSGITWEIQNTSNYVSTNLVPNSWYDSNEQFVNLDSWLSGNNYSKLMAILELKKGSTDLFPSLSPGDFIVVEPMTYIDGYFGTAYEFGNAFLTLTNTCYSEGNFCWNYSGLVFGGINSTKNTSRRCGGIFHKIIYLEENVPTLGLTVFEDIAGCGATSFGIFESRNSCLKDSTCGRGIGVYEYNDIYNGSIEITKYKTGTTTPVSGAGFTLYSDSSCTAEIKSEQFTNNEGKVTFLNLNKGTYYYKETTVPNDFRGNQSCNSVQVSNGSKSTVAAYNTQNPRTGDLKINIKIKDTDTLITSSSATFEIYSGENCNNLLIDTVTTSMGSITTELSAGTYSIKEKSAPDGYSASNPVCVKSSTVITAGIETTENIYYEPTCATKLRNLGDNPTKQQLFNLYREYPNNRNLLNLENPSCTASNCGDNSLSLNCLSGSTNTSEFNSTNLSCYNGEPIIDIYGNYIGFCQTTYNLSNNLNTNKFYSKAGRFLIHQNENIITIFEKNELDELVEKTITSSFIATDRTSRICYSLNELNTDDIKTLPEYYVYFGDNNLDNIADQLQNTSNTNIEPQVLTENSLYMYEIVRGNNYSLNPLYLEKITGKYSSIKTNSTISEPIYGLLSRFDTQSGAILFKVNSNSSNLCTFETKKEIISPNLELEFRIIDTKEPFNRNTMSNWSNGIDNSKDNDTVKKYIKDTVNSYGLNKYGDRVNPKYKIILNSNDIMIIREYNKSNKYDDYLTQEVEYSGNKILRNSFLYSLEEGKLNNKNLSGKLYNSKY